MLDSGFTGYFRALTCFLVSVTGAVTVDVAEAAGLTVVAAAGTALLSAVLDISADLSCVGGVSGAASAALTGSSLLIVTTFSLSAG